MRVLSARIEPPVRAEDGSTASTATLWPVPVRKRAERIDGGRLADARHAGDADANGLAGRRQQILHELPRRRLVVAAPALDQRDGARDDGALARQNAARAERARSGVRGRLREDINLP